MKKPPLLLCLLLTSFVAACSAPETFIKTTEPMWASIEIRDDLTYDQAWPQILDMLIKRFDIEVSQKENGYIRTGWLYTWTGEVTDYYRVRITIKFSQDRKKLELKTEAYYKDYTGYDTRLLSTIKSDIMGSVGRTTR